ncbi:type II toxin-antitoxin system RelB/DinJ family antitoxin [Fructilactobacillus sp. Tb1]|uniref:type II toxin-antitoxin system RelB/DinJ family antitoxin n=1 Tax=Fructilactobacillus sp. Tb1 TaxID=3422304 RepID=UPI003D296276
MENQSRIQVRVDKETKDKATKLFKNLGIDMSGAINMFLKQSVRDQSIPFTVTLESPESIQARNDALTGHNLHSVNSIKELMKELNED